MSSLAIYFPSRNTFFDSLHGTISSSEKLLWSQRMWHRSWRFIRDWWRVAFCWKSNAEKLLKIFGVYLPIALPVIVDWQTKSFITITGPLGTSLPFQLGWTVALIVLIVVLVSSCALTWISIPTLKFLESEMRYYGSRDLRKFSTTVQNTSKLRSIKKCKVTWNSPGIRGPIILRRCDTKVTDPVEIDLAPEDKLVVEYFCVGESSCFVPCSHHPDYPDGIPIGLDEYKVQLSAFGEDVPTVSQSLVISAIQRQQVVIFVDVAGSGLLKIYPPTYSADGSPVNPKTENHLSRIRRMMAWVHWWK